jgi:hypothetical protein
MKCHHACLGLFAIYLLSSVALADDKAKPADAAPPDQEALVTQFAQTMSGATLEGSYTVTGEKDAETKTDKYTLGKVKHIKDDLWSFETRIQYGDHDVTVPLPVEVKWAGDTPVITLTDMEIPNLGTFTARVVVYRGHYAGFWSAGDHGGNMWGHIVTAEEKDKAEGTDAAKPAN